VYKRPVYVRFGQKSAHCQRYHLAEWRVALEAVQLGQHGLGDVDLVVLAVSQRLDALGIFNEHVCVEHEIF